MANQLKKEEENIKLLDEQLEKEKSKVLEMEGISNNLSCNLNQ